MKYTVHIRRSASIEVRNVGFHNITDQGLLQLFNQKIISGDRMLATFKKWKYFMINQDDK